MKQGDLVRMKYEMWWRLKERKDYSEDVALVLETAHNAVKLLHSNGDIRAGLAEHYEVVKT